MNAKLIIGPDYVRIDFSDSSTATVHLDDPAIGALWSAVEKMAKKTLTRGIAIEVDE